MGWFSLKTKEKPVHYEEGCVKCGRIDFDYSSYYDEFTCNSCGWTTVSRPRGKFNIVSNDNLPIVKESPKQPVTRSGEPSTISLSLQEVEKIVNEYGNTIINHALAPHGIADVSKLPYSKSKIKEAIIKALKNTEDLKLQDTLKTGYLSLSDWQEGVGTTDLGFDFSNFGDGMNTIESAMAFLEEKRKLDKWKDKIAKDYFGLELELEKAGFPVNTKYASELYQLFKAGTSEIYAKDLEEAQNRVELFVVALKVKGMAGLIADVKSLPVTKIEVKKAIITLLRASHGKKEAQGNLRRFYLELAYWQVGVGENPLDVGLTGYPDDMDVFKSESIPVGLSETDRNWQQLVISDTKQCNREILSVPL